MQDLYQTPFALVGIGLGARVAASFASKHPRLVGALGLSELWEELPADSTFHPLQAAQFDSEAQAAACVCANLWVRTRLCGPVTVPVPCPLMPPHLSYRVPAHRVTRRAQLQRLLGTTRTGCAHRVQGSCATLR